MKKIVSRIMPFLVLIGMLTLAFNIQPVKASVTIYIRTNGSIDPPTAPITTVDNVTYTFTDNIYSADDYAIVIARDNIALDGNGYTLQGTEFQDLQVGISLWDEHNVTIRNIRITAFKYPIWVDYYSSYISILENNITDNTNGILLFYYSNHNSISGNTIEHANGDRTICLDYWSDYNTISGNKIIDNHCNYLAGSHFNEHWE